MDRLKQCSEENRGGTSAEIKSNHSDSQISEDVFTQIPLSLHEFITPHKESIATGLYYLSLGERLSSEEEKSITSYKNEKNKTIRFKLSSLGKNSLDHLIKMGYTKKSAVIASIEYLKNKPQTILKVRL